MAYKIDKSYEAEQDMFGILDYLTETLASVGAARHFYRLLNECYKRLHKYPLMYPLCRDENLAVKGFRYAPVMRYIVFYKIDEEKNIVEFIVLFMEQ